MKTEKISTLDFRIESDHNKEMLRLVRLVKLGNITKLDAIIMFQDYLEVTEGRRAKPTEYPFRGAA